MRAAILTTFYIANANLKFNKSIACSPLQNPLPLTCFYLK